MIESLKDLQNLARKEQRKSAKKEQELRVCIGSTCSSLGSIALKDSLQKKARDSSLDKECSIKGVGCNGLCSEANVVIHKDKVFKKETILGRIQEPDEGSLLQKIKDKSSLREKECDTQTPFFKNQKKIVLENAGIIDPESIEDYIAHGGYHSFLQALEEMDASEVIEEVKTSGLRGRGGGGYPAGLKWEAVAKIQSDEKYIVCNGEEGDPGAFMDRAIMEADPHKVIEGMALAGFASGASKGFVYVRAEYPEAVAKLKKAIKQAKNIGILGSQIIGSNFNFDVDVIAGGGAFVCGEATSLIASIEGNRGNPRQKPPHLSDYGLWGKPTILNNVETLANIPSIIKNGGKWYTQFGTKESPGTKVFSLSGTVVHTGLAEVPMGISLRELIYDIGGGVPGGKKLKAIQTGGPSGGCIPEELLDTKVDYDSLKAIGSMMGSGGVIVIDEDTSMLEVAHFFMDFNKSESCGKCVPCRVGTTEVTTLLEKFLAKKATKADFELLKEICKVMQETSLCGLGQAAANPVMSTIKYFQKEYLEGMCDDTK